jgi:5-methylcytosine-specific restriction endonuclease McrA
MTTQTNNNIINSPTLVLNKSLDAIGFTPLYKTLNKVFSFRAKYVDNETFQHLTWSDWSDLFSIPIEDDESIYGDYQWLNVNRFKVRLPRIVVLQKYNKIPHTRVRLTRRNLLIRDGYRCQYTAKKVTSRTGTIDHIMPKCRGGLTTWDNVVISTFEVNVEKGGRTPEEAGLKLLSTPREPHWNPLYTFGQKLPKEWKYFVRTDQWNEFGYWDVELEP